MPKFGTKRIVAHKAAEMFALVADVEKYPQFLPMCKELRVLDKIQQENLTIVTAVMSVGYKIFCESFTTIVQLDPDNNIIKVSYVDGPFKYLENRWAFVDLECYKSEIEFFIDYEFKSKSLGLLMGSVFDAAFLKFAEAFEKRADAVYKP
ncbi:SRPBCC family protein [Bartonella sp. TP]|uniref:type II toxin-antitoxin system RatA family toxin n=1 Tax=Bartonella sp. TP TaxID=3057550 RepID=UPI0025B1E6E1|nr:SRPBCC family protein [Bartonella sp. TP]MDN5248844.1 SRPBCC family protein [Alphaproteobacteria bacterium]WJW80090.1 SRPBCC family protein [Bartonella sp. TP]